MEKIRVAIADDHTLVRKGFRAILEQSGEFEIVAEAKNGLELVAACNALPTPPAICMLDVNMPEMDGYETLLTLKAQYPQMRFLVLTQLEHEFVIIRMLKAGASGYLLKTTDPEDLMQALRTMLDHSLYANHQVNGRLISLISSTDRHRNLKLSEDEIRFLRLCCSDLGYKEIATLMEKPERTVAFYRTALFTKLRVQSRTGLALSALQLGLIAIEDVGTWPDAGELRP